MSGTLKIRCESGVGHHARVWLDDMEVSHFLNGLTLTLDVGDANTAELRLVGCEIDVDAETLVALEAYVPRPPVQS